MLDVKRSVYLLATAAFWLCLSPLGLEGAPKKTVTEQKRDKLRDAIKAYQADKSNSKKRDALVDAYIEVQKGGAAARTLADRLLKEAGTSYDKLLAATRAMAVAPGGVVTVDKAALDKAVKEAEEKKDREIEKLKNETAELLLNASKASTNLAQMQQDLNTAMQKNVGLAALEQRVDKVTGVIIRLSALLNRMEKGKARHGQDENFKKFVDKIKSTMVETARSIGNEAVPVLSAEAIRLLEKDASNVYERNYQLEIGIIKKQVESLKAALPNIFAAQTNVLKDAEQGKKFDTASFAELLRSELDSIGSLISEEQDAEFIKAFKAYEEEYSAFLASLETSGEAFSEFMTELFDNKYKYMGIEGEAALGVPVMPSGKLDFAAVAMKTALDYVKDLNFNGTRLIALKRAVALGKDVDAKFAAFKNGLTLKSQLSEVDKHEFNLAGDTLMTEAELPEIGEVAPEAEGKESIAERQVREAKEKEEKERREKEKKPKEKEAGGEGDKPISGKGEGGGGGGGGGGVKSAVVQGILAAAPALAAKDDKAFKETYGFSGDPADKPTLAQLQRFSADFLETGGRKFEDPDDTTYQYLLGLVDKLGPDDQAMGQAVIGKLGT